jgi:hypothetical protein
VNLQVGGGSAILKWWGQVISAANSGLNAVETLIKNSACSRNSQAALLRSAASRSTVPPTSRTAGALLADPGENEANISVSRMTKSDKLKDG